MKAPTETMEIGFYNGGKISRIVEPIIRENPVDIFFNSRKVATIACTGIHLEELAVGFIFSIGAIGALGDIQKIEVNPDGSRVDVLTTNEIPAESTHSELFVLSSGAKTSGSRKKKDPITSDMLIRPTKIIEFMEELLTSSPLHKETHGTHCSALADTEKIIVLRDDIGRHNTIDMLGGYAILNGIDCSDKVIVKTGRVSSEIAEKVWTLGIPIMISHSVPTSEAVGILRNAGITLIGHVRGGSFKVYCNERRIQF
ncbi:MAG TPA: formate dehydrogenase accessory sulfurtransferase FdhD [Syntrophales bacterium]|nr:formate dehydrogenase accessory sulfurtransferase FdhD [Syntrophales bacterium]HPQ43438.1 formate dehydrogenase accessory sulfurtransferase FdhD [Syntrophales bacterium]